jgi:hypothetical protein
MEIKELKKLYEENPNLENLANLRTNFIESMRANKSYEGIFKLLQDLYPDKTHFIDELIQNADDAYASSISFTLLKDCLEFRHNGTRLFNIEDVDAITNIAGNPSKLGDLTAIGKFGIGFKSVYAYTNRPEIHSGSFHFAIEDYLVPIEIDSINSGRETVFLFPLKSNSLFPIIRDALSSIIVDTLLFLNNIRRIDYKIIFNSSAEESHSIIASSIENSLIVDIKHNSNLQTNYEKEKKYLVFKKNYTYHNELGKQKEGMLGVAFQVDKQNSTLLVPTNGQTFMYLPLRNFQSGLKFHINAPFFTSVARDNIIECSHNRRVIKHLGHFINEIPIMLRDKGFIDNVNSYRVFPILCANDPKVSSSNDSISDYLHEIVFSFIDVFRKFNVSKVYDKSPFFLAGNRLCKFPRYHQDVRTLVDSELLSKILKPNDDEHHTNAIYWADIKDYDKRDGRFLELVSENTFSIKVMLENMNLKFFSNSEEKVKWFTSLYSILFSFLNNSNILKTEKEEVLSLIEENPIYIIKEGESINNYHHDEVYFLESSLLSLSSPNAHIFSLGILTSVSSIDNATIDKATNFIESQKLKPFSKVEYYKFKFKEYNKYLKDYDEYFHTLNQFLHHYIIDNSLETAFPDALLADDDGELFFLSINEIYLDAPYLETNYKKIAEIQGFYPLSTIYKERISEIEFLDNFIDLCKKKNIRISLRIDPVICITHSSSIDNGYIKNNEIISFLKYNLYNYSLLKEKNSSDIERQEYENFLYYLSNKARRYGNLFAKKYFDILSDSFTDRLLMEIKDYEIRGIEKILATNNPSINEMLYNVIFNNQLFDNEKSPFCARIEANDEKTEKKKIIFHLPSRLFIYLKENSWIPSKYGVLMRPDEVQIEAIDDHFFAYLDFNIMDLLGMKIDKRISYLLKLGANPNSNDFKEFLSATNLEHQPFPTRPLPNYDIVRAQKIIEEIKQAPKIRYENITIFDRTSKPRSDAREYLKNYYKNENDQFICQMCRGVIDKENGRDYDFNAHALFNNQNDTINIEHESLFIALCPKCSHTYKRLHTGKNTNDLVEKIFTHDFSNLSYTIDLDSNENHSLHFVEVHLRDIHQIIKYFKEKKE